MLMEPVEIDSTAHVRAVLTEAHDRALAELFLYLTDGDVEGLGPFLQIFERHVVSFGCEGRKGLRSVAVGDVACGHLGSA